MKKKRKKTKDSVVAWHELEPSDKQWDSFERATVSSWAVRSSSTTESVKVNE